MLEQKRFAEVVRRAARTFSEHKAELADLSPRFWVAWLDLDAASDGDWENLKTVFMAAYKQLGAPGDFGYGTACGDALRDVYDSWNALISAMKAATVSS